MYERQHSGFDFFNFLFSTFVDLFVILILSAVVGATFYWIASYLGVPELGKALMFSTLTVISALVFNSGTLSYIKRRVNRASLLSLLAVVVVLFYLHQYAFASILLGAIFAPCFQVRQEGNP